MNRRSTPAEKNGIHVLGRIRATARLNSLAYGKSDRNEDEDL